MTPTQRADDERIADLAARWLSADEERRLRRSERGYAHVLARVVSVERGYNPDTDRVGWPTELTASQLEAVERCDRAHKAYRDAAAKARGLRSSLRKAVRARLPKIEPDADISEAYRELCDAEATAAAAYNDRGGMY